MTDGDTARLELFASLIGGLGLFLVGIRTLGSNLQQLAGPRLRAALHAATRGPIATAAAGLALGGLTQSSNAVTVIASSLVAAALLRLRAAMALLAWANVGTVGLVLLATVDLRLAMLWLVGLVGFLSAFGVDRSGRAKPALGAVLGLALLFIGLDLLKVGAVPLADLPDTRWLAGLVAEMPLAVFLLAAALTLVVQSSSTVAILVLTLHDVGLLSFDQAVIAIGGSSLGSGLAAMLTSGAWRGAAARLPLFQALLKASGVALFGALFLLERATGLPLVVAALRAVASDPAQALGLMFAALQVVPALLLPLVIGRAEAWLVRARADTGQEVLSRPAYLHDRALDDAATALELVDREQRRLIDRLPTLLDAVRDGGGGLDRRNTLTATAALEKATAQFLMALRGRAAGGALVERAVALDLRLSLITALRETLGEFGDTVAARQADITPALGRLIEALHLLLLQLAESDTTEDAALLRAMTEDRGDMMEGVRRRLADSAPIGDAARETLFRATAQFERAVWLIRRLGASVTVA